MSTSPGTSAPATVQTVRGPIGVDELGVTLSHEHLFVLSSEFQHNYPSLWDRESGARTAAEQLELAYELGVRTVVDMTVIGQGRDIGLVQQVAARTRVNLLVATGIYAAGGLPPFLRFRGPGCAIEVPDPLVDLLEQDITEGIGGTGIRAALLKFAVEDGVPDRDATRTAAAVAEVHSRTGVPIVVHSNPFEGNGLALVELLTGLGVAAERVVVAHAGDSADASYLHRLAETGCFIGFDRFGMEDLAPDPQRVRMIADLVARGHAGQLLLSQDCASHIDYVTVEQRHALYPRWSYTELHTRVFDDLAAAGVAPEIVTSLMVDNPRRMLTPGLAAGAASPREVAGVGR
ncbi:phosphotriesterase family protein [Kitasatospora azatica]|uniref:phosphotriesterase family protein n=1 Tax=Kitasatospora azatica TaxID=58347 RepID=UPI00068CF58D|nr:hypothetical protein [Kitasatospora azatica]